MAVLFCRDLEVELVILRTNPAGLGQRVAVLVGLCYSRVSSAGAEDIVVLSGGKLLVIMSPPLRCYPPAVRT